MIERKIGVHQNNPGNTVQLIRVALEEWGDLPQEKINNQIEIMPRRIMLALRLEMAT